MGGDRYEGGPQKGTSFVQRIREARRIAQPAAHSPALTDIPYRAVSIYPSTVLARLGIAPNQITILWIVLGIAGVLALASPSYGVRIAGAVLLEVSYLFDFVDGEVARLTNRTSQLGYLLDLAGHGIIKTALFLAIGYGLFASTHRYEMLMLAFLACVGVSNGQMVPFYVGEAFRRTESGRVPAAQTARSLLRKLLSWSVYAFESPGLYLLVLLGAVFNGLEWVLVFYGILSPLWFLYRLVRFRL
ncbi:MAG: CDP-alcohol phosphatidyltransferase family protein [Terriglobia bacterium]